MNYRYLRTAFPAFATLLVLSACGPTDDPAADSAKTSVTASTTLASGLTVKEQIEARQKALKKVGKSFKSISDQLKSNSPDLATIQAAAAVIPTTTADMQDWFPAGTGPESGVETDALPAIWNTKDEFLQKLADMQKAAADLDAVARAGDVATIAKAFKATGGTCKGCHDDYRLDD